MNNYSEYFIRDAEEEQPPIKKNTQIFIENDTDITISRCEQSQNEMISDLSSVSRSASSPILPLKSGALPLVYIKNKSKFPTMTQNVLFGGRGGRPIVLPSVLPKQPITIVPPGSRLATTFVTMVRPDGTTAEKTLMQGTQSQKFVLAGPMPKLPIPVKITPMPKLNNNPSVTVTTSTLQQGKFSVLPVPPPQDGIPGKVPKVFNFQIADGKIYSSVPQGSKADNDITNKTYELSIAEESVSDVCDISKVSDNNGQVDSSLGRSSLKFSHGISILKKSFISQETTNQSSTKPVPSLGSSTDITLIKANGEEEKILVTPHARPKKTERSRRKSMVCLRQELDDMEITFPDYDIKEDDLKHEQNLKEEEQKEASQEPKSEPTEEPKSESSEEPKSEPTEEPKHTKLDNYNKSEREPLDPKSLLDVKPDPDALKLLTWDENIGSLPGSNLKFLLNEFGIIEYLSDEDYQKLLNKKEKKHKEKEDMEKEVQCKECGCYGIRVDFNSSNYCSFDCQEAAEKEQIKKETEFASAAGNKCLKKKFSKTKSENEIIDESAEEENSNDVSSQDKFTYPWACKKKGFSWSKYLIHVNAKAAPVKLFKDPFPYTRNGFKSGMKLEGVDPQHPPYFCLLTVADTNGYRIRLHFDGYPDNYDFWTYADSMNIFPMGWCEKYGHELRPPPPYKEDNFNWIQYLKVTKSTAAPKHLFVNRAGQAICPNGFRIGMKLEAVDKTNSALICVATVRDMMDNRILVHFDGWDDIYDYWADPTSPYIHPVGWCDQYGHDLTAPSDYPTPEDFTWEKYLKETKAVAAPVRAFKQRPACGFKRGMRLECVDKRVPQLIRVATVDDVKEHQIRIHFDGWPDRYSYWVDDDSPDIHPIGWCQKTGHPLEPPLTPDDVYDFLECPTVGCRGQGHTNGLKYLIHTSQQFCPYAEGNIDAEKVLPDRLLSPDRSPEAKEPISRHLNKEKCKPRLGRPPKWLKDLQKQRSKSEEPIEKKPKRKYNKRTKKEEEEDEGEEEEGEEEEESERKSSADNSKSSLEERARKFIDESKILPVEKESWKRHSEFLEEFINTDDNPTSWSCNDVRDFVALIPGCNRYSGQFCGQRIDGEAFLHLSQDDILRVLKFKLGPAIKLYNSIVLLRDQYSKKKVKQDKEKVLKVLVDGNFEQKKKCFEVLLKDLQLSPS